MLKQLSTSKCTAIRVTGHREMLPGDPLNTGLDRTRQGVRLLQRWTASAFLKKPWVPSPCLLLLGLSPSLAEACTGNWKVGLVSRAGNE